MEREAALPSMEIIQVMKTNMVVHGNMVFDPEKCFILASEPWLPYELGSHSLDRSIFITQESSVVK